MINVQPQISQFFEEQKKLLTTAIQESKNYNSFFITIAYAGFFTLFNGIKGYLNTKDLLWITILMTISIFFFVLWEIGKMIYNGIIFLSFANSIKKDPMNSLKLQEQFRTKIFESNKILIPLWIFVLIVSSTAGFIAVGILINRTLSLLVFA